MLCKMNCVFIGQPRINNEQEYMAFICCYNWLAADSLGKNMVLNEMIDTT